MEHSDLTMSVPEQVDNIGRRRCRIEIFLEVASTKLKLRREMTESDAEFQEEEAAEEAVEVEQTRAKATELELEPEQVHIVEE